MNEITLQSFKRETSRSASVELSGVDMLNAKAVRFHRDGQHWQLGFLREHNVRTGSMTFTAVPSRS